MIKHIITNLNHLILYYFLAASACYVMLLFLSIPEILNNYRRRFVKKLLDTGHRHKKLPISVIVPAFNEETRILNCIESLFNSTYDNIKVIIMNDGSEDGTLDLLKKKYKLQPHFSLVTPEDYEAYGMKRYYVSATHPNLSLVDKKHSGVGNSLNLGLRAARTSFVITVDADSIVEPDAISELVYATLSQKDVIIAGGAICILNGCSYQNGIIDKKRLPKRLLPALQAIEYIRSFVFGRTGWNLFKGPLSLSGTSTLLDRRLTLETGGFDTNNPAQDAEVVVRQHQAMGKKKKRYKVAYVPSAFTWTIVPDTLKSYATQRVKWQWGFTRSFFKHLSMFMNPRYGVVGFFSYPFYLLVETLGPVVEVLVYLLILLSLAFGVFDGKSALIFIILAWGFLAFTTLASMLMNLITFNRYHKTSDIFRSFFLVFVEMFGFRQILILIRLWGTIKYLLFPKYRK